MMSAKGTIAHYLRLACQEAGVNWNYENDNELSLIEEEIRAEARAEVGQELNELRQRITNLERRVAEASVRHIGELQARVEQLERRLQGGN
ncbi:hypothetical protein [Nonomuraea sp. NPDC050202]|uniref:hypothetical protein n=1 Tax=Nonomuraea sp. NPDC050202 TaxID=3155035 RepID=UPI0033C900CE